MGRMLKAGFLAMLICSSATTAFARTASLKDAGVALYIFLIIGGVIVLLQLIPAAILFFSFIGTTIGLLGKKRTALEGEKAGEDVPIPHYKPATAEKVH